MSVHSCGPNCQKPLCVANRRIEELEYKRNEAIAIAEREVILRKKLQARIEELEAEVKYWEGRIENGSNAKHWPEFGPGGGV